MQATKLLAHCEDCGHAYRVPSADRTYPCKECEGTVVVDEDELDDDYEVEEEEQPDYEHRRLSERHHHEQKASPLRWVIPILAIVVMGGGGLYSLGYFEKWFGGEKDLNVVAAEFRTVWSGGDRAGINEFLHPSAADAVNDSLDAVVKRAGWTAGFGAVTSLEPKLTAGTADSPHLGETHLVLAGAPAWVKVKWQFEPSRNRWLVTSLASAPPALGTRVEQFTELWAKSEVSALRPMFSKKNAPVMLERFGERSLFFCLEHAS